MLSSWCNKQEEIKLSHTQNNILKFLKSNRGVCLAINGSWGVGKTYYWKSIEKKMKQICLKNDNNLHTKIVYIDLFGKDDFKQILEEITFKVFQTQNKIVKNTSKILSECISFLSNQIINISSETLFSFLKKEDFKDIIVCFDNIERKSSKLAFKDIMGLVSLLKEDKNCNVVMIFNKQKVFLDIEDEIDIVTLMIGETCENTNKIYSKKNLKHYLQKYYKDEMDYQQYKEKVIDYEVVIDENNEVALEIIKQKLIVKENDLKPAITLIIYNHYRKYLDYNLRLLQKVILQINYFYKECFSKLYKKEEGKIFLDALNITYDALFRNLKSYYIDKTEDFDFPNYKKYLNNVLILDFLSLNELKEYFANNLKQATFDYFHQIYLDYTLSRLSSYDFAQRINHDLEVLKKIYF